LVGKIADPVAEGPFMPPIRMKISRETAIEILRKLKPDVQFTSDPMHSKNQKEGPHLPPPPAQWKVVAHIGTMNYEGKAPTEHEATVEAALAALKGLNIKDDIDEPEHQPMAQASRPTLTSERTMV